MKLTELLKQITPLPWTEINQSPMEGNIEPDDYAYIVHTANVLPELVEAAKTVRCPAEGLNGHDLTCMRCWCYGMMKSALSRAEEVKDP